VVGAALLTDRDPAHAEVDEYGRSHPPMLVPAVGRTLAGFTRGPGWEAPEVPLEGDFTPLQPERKGKFTPVILEDNPEPTVTPVSPAPVNTPELSTQFQAASEREEQVEQETGEELEQHFSQVVGDNPSPDSGMANAALRLEGAGSRLERAADRLEGAVRQGQPAPNTSTAAGATSPMVIPSDAAMTGSETLLTVNNDPALMQEDEE
ncbi:MAG: hypothetical protein IAE83_21265, partial [Anaerolinea sp.]|nr:hypothetical protein [Anaerolinea sp.]